LEYISFFVKKKEKVFIAMHKIDIKLDNWTTSVHTRSRGWNRKNISNLLQVTNKRSTLWPCMGKQPKTLNAYKIMVAIFSPSLPFASFIFTL
jgi:hypothetical protein